MQEEKNMLITKNNKNAQALRDSFYTVRHDVMFFHDVRDKSPYNHVAPIWTSNENGAYIPQMLKPTDTVLTIGGSMDSIFDMTLYGIRNIYAVDVNPVQIPICWLKYYALTKLDSYDEFKAFAIDASVFALSDRLASKILKRTDISEENKFWRLVYKENNSLEMRLKYFANETYYLRTGEGRRINFEYVKKDNWEKVRKALSESTIYLERKDIFDMYIPENVFDVVCLSNLHNFYPIDYYVDKLKELSSKLKKNGKIVLYFIGMKPEWFRSWDKNLLPDIQEEDLNRAYIKDGIKEFGVLQQINNTGNLYKKLKKYFKVLIIPVKTGKGYMFYNTPTDCILVLQSK